MLLRPAVRTPTLLVALGASCVAAWSVPHPWLHGQEIALRQPGQLGPIEPIEPAEAPRALTLEELEQMALAANPSIARAQAEVTAARGNWLQVGLPPNPEIGYEGQQLGSRGLAEQEGIVIAQELVRHGKLRLNREVAARQIAQAEQELAAQQQRVRTDVRIAFYEVLVAQRQIDLTRMLTDIAERGRKAADVLLMAREGTRAEVLQAELEVENASILARNAQNRYLAAWQTLASVVGRPDLARQPLAGEVDGDARTFEWEATRDRLLSTSPEIAAQVMRIERARWALERARWEPRPNLNIEGIVNWRDEGIDGRSDGGIRATIPVPAWNKNQGGILEAQAELTAAQRALEQLELDLQHRLAPVYERYANARHQVERYRARILPAAQESLELTRTSYEAGEIGFIALLTAQRTFAQTNLNYLDALRDLRTAEAELEGLLLRDSLEAR